MPDHSHDAWDSLADSLGARPAGEESTPRPTPPAQPAPRPQTELKRPRPSTPPAAASWDDLASELGVAGTPPVTPAPQSHQRRPPVGELKSRVDHAEPRPAATPQTDRGERHDRVADDDRRGHMTDLRDAEGREVERGDEKIEERGLRRDDSGTAGRTEGRGEGRRRRGRRGGRRRRGERGEDGRRTDGTEPGVVRIEDRESGRFRDGDEPRTRDDERRFQEGASGDRGPAADRPSERHAGADRLGHDDAADFDAELFAPAAEGEGKPRSGPASADTDDGGERPRRRRRRGRRGGRGRGREGALESSAGGPSAGSEAARGRAEPGQLDDEPLPSGYGVRQARPTEPARGQQTDRDTGSSARQGDGEERGGRRRRRRRGGEGRTRETSRSRSAAGRVGTDRESSRPGRGQRRDGDSRSSSTLSRGRRGDFATVSGGYDEDDEGLEFLGVEDATRRTERREPSPEDEEILAESGLSTVLDVPSWVEAIGIVIAGNLDARSRSPRSGEGRPGGGRGR